MLGIFWGWAEMAALERVEPAKWSRLVYSGVVLAQRVAFVAFGYVLSRCVGARARVASSWAVNERTGA